MEGWDYGLVLDYSGDGTPDYVWDDFSHFPQQKHLLERVIHSLDEKSLDGFSSLRRLILFSGPALSGKSSFLKAFANQNSLKLYVVQVSKLLTGSFEGTAQKVVDLFQLVRNISADDPVIIHFDHLEFLGWEQLDPSDSGEFKRMVSVFISELGDLAGGNDRLIITAETSKPEIIDSSLRARFLSVRLDVSSPEVRRLIWSDLQDRISESVGDVSWDISAIVTATDGYQIGQFTQILTLALLEYEKDKLERFSTDLILKQLEVVNRGEVELSLSSDDIDLAELSRLLEPYYRQGD